MGPSEGSTLEVRCNNSSIVSMTKDFDKISQKVPPERVICNDVLGTTWWKSIFCLKSCFITNHSHLSVYPCQQSWLRSNWKEDMVLCRQYSDRKRRIQTARYLSIDEVCFGNHAWFLSCRCRRILRNISLPVWNLTYMELTLVLTLRLP